MKKNKNSNTKIFLASFLSLALLTINIIVEVVTTLPVESSLLLRSLLIITILFLFNQTSRRFKKFVKLALIVSILLFLLNILLNIANVYQLNRYQSISQLCQTSPQLCISISNIFYKLRIFRFITLSSYFFTIPILTLTLLSHKAKLKISKKNYLQKTFFLILGIIMFSNLLKSFQAIYLSVIQSYQVLDENYYDRFTFKKGGASYYGWIRVYSNFVIAKTNENVNILIPPQEMPYKMEGNRNYFRWFMYPRKLYHLEELSNEKEIKIDYIVLSAGECANNLCVWPNYEIDKNQIEEILLIDRKTQKIETVSGLDYKPESFYQKWGLIKLK